MKQKAATDQARRGAQRREATSSLRGFPSSRVAREELLSEIHALGRQLSMKTAELEADSSKGAFVRRSLSPGTGFEEKLQCDAPAAPTQPGAAAGEFCKLMPHAMPSEPPS